MSAEPDWKPRILIAEDDASMRRILQFNLTEEGFEVEVVARGDTAVAQLPTRRAGDTSPPPFDLVLTDVKMPGADGFDVLRAARACHPDIQVVLVTAFGTVDHAIEAMALGAADYITKPFQRAELKARVAHALERVTLRRENRALRDRAQAALGRALVMQSAVMVEVLSVVDRVAPADVAVLVTGESGTGKELIARRLHERSGRGGAFVPLNCAALPAALLESELFGHERGAFTGANRAHKGKFEQAEGGTLMLDEIGELPLDLQAKILRVIEEGVVDRVGGRAPTSVDVRLVAATNRELEQEAAAGRFREDLFHRISVIPIHLPALRDRREDIPLLVSHFLREQGADGLSVAPALMAELQRRPWPGNVRQLKNTVSRMILLRRAEVLDLVDLAPPGAVGASVPTPVPVASLPPGGPEAAQTSPDTGALLRPGELVLPGTSFSLPELEREVLVKAVARHGGNQSAAARYLQIPRHVLLYRLSKYDRDGDEG